MIAALQWVWIVLTLLFAYGVFALFLGPKRDQLRREFVSARAHYATRGGIVGRFGSRVNSWHWWIVERSLSVVAILGAAWVVASAVLTGLTR